MDIAALTAFLAPFLPYFARAGENLAEEAGTKLGSEAWEHAKRLWGKLRPKVEAKPAANEAAADVADRPGDERARSALELQLEKLLADDPTLAGEVARLWEDARAANVVAIGDRSVAVGGSAHGVFITGDDNVVGE